MTSWLPLSRCGTRGVEWTSRTCARGGSDRTTGSPCLSGSSGLDLVWQPDRMAEKVRFETVIEPARGPGATVALVPMEHVHALGGMKQKRAFGWVNGVEFMTATFPYKGEGLWVGVPKAARVAAGLVVGDRCSMELMLDEAPRTVAVPDELAAAFETEPDLSTRFEKLSF